MISTNNKNMQEAGETLYTLSKEDQIRYQCEAREEYRRTWNTVKLQMEEYQSTIAELKSTIAELKAAITEKDFAIAGKNSVISERASTIAALKADIARFRTETQ